MISMTFMPSTCLQRFAETALLSLDFRLFPCCVEQFEVTFDGTSALEIWHGLVCLLVLIDTAS